MAISLLLLPLFLPGVWASVWAYEERHGHEYWDEISRECIGQAQSPINLDTSLLHRTGHPGLEGLAFTGYHRVTDKNTNLVNNGHSLQLNLLSHPEGQTQVHGGPLSVPYNFHQLHFHWGDTDKQGSEHTIDRDRFPLEVHLVHVSSALQWGGGRSLEAGEEGSLADLLEGQVQDRAGQGREGLAVVAGLFQISEEDNSLMAGIINKISEVREAGREARLAANSFNLAKLIWPAVEGSYFHYHGSLTTPGCNEVVKWIVLNSTLAISSRQLEQFRTVLNPEGGRLLNNFRPVQPLNKRRVSFTEGGARP